MTITGDTGTVVATDGQNPTFANGSVAAMCFDGAGNLLLACGGSIRKLSVTTNGVTLAGSFTQTGFTNGPGNLARFSGATGLCVVGATVYVADSSNQRIRSITNNPTPQVVFPANLQLSAYPGMKITGSVGRAYQVQSSLDMTNWTTQSTFVLASSPFLWIDTNAIAGTKFYRTLLLP